MKIYFASSFEGGWKKRLKIKDFNKSLISYFYIKMQKDFDINKYINRKIKENK